ncbi:MAG TPA: hypothetical protein EYH09_02370 [Candidatus Nanopusillus sp.]|nr:hypothetical protein [Candidatus Nanopusillus sp.]HIP90074.1 hypothetical protein [Candidatus Nanopusillus sp.]
MSRKEIYKTKLKFSGKFNINSLYEGLYYSLNKRGWSGIPGGDYYETYYYHKVTPDGLLFIEINWEGKKVFWDDEVTIIWYITLTMRVSAYNIRAQSGSVEIEFKTEHEIKEPEEPRPNTKIEKILVKYFKIHPSWLKKTWSSVRSQPVSLSGKYLYAESEEIKQEIIKMLNAISLP